MPTEPPATNAPPAAAASSAPAAATKPRRRWLRYSLRSLLLVMLASGCVLGLVGREIQRGRAQLAAIGWVESKGGAIYFEEPAEPFWQQQWLGAWYPNPVSHVDLEDADIEGIAPLTNFAALKALRLEGTRVVDLAPLESLQELVFVDLTNTPVTQEQIESLTQDRELLAYRRTSPQYLPGPNGLRVYEDRMSFTFWDSDEVWEFTPPVPIDPQYLVASWSRQGDLVLVLYQNYAFACDLNRREILWHYQAEGYLRRLAGDDQRLVVHESRPTEDPYRRIYTVLGLEVETGQEVFRWDPPRVLGGRGDRVQCCFAAEGYYVLGDERYEMEPDSWCYVLDASGRLLASFDARGLQLLPLGEDLLLQTTQEVVCLSPTGEERWSIPFECDHWEPAAKFLELPGGDLILYGYSEDADFGVDLLRLNAETGEGIWTYHCADQGWGGSVEGYGQEVFLQLKGDRLHVICRADMDTFVEALEPATGRQLYRLDFPWRR